MTVRFLVGDVFEQLATLDDNSVDLVMTSPPFLALRSYLPADHPDKAKEIGSEPTPAAFIDTLLRLTAEWERVLAPHGSICVELGDTYSGSGGSGGDYRDGHLRDGQARFEGSAKRSRTDVRDHWASSDSRPDWPLAKSMCGIPWLYPLSLAYGINPLTGEESPAGMWRVRNVVAWCRPNPPVGALSDKYRPATSYLTIATKSKTRWFDLNAVRTPQSDPNHIQANNRRQDCRGGQRETNDVIVQNPAGAPPLDYWQPTELEQELWDEWGDQFNDNLWEIPTAGYPGSHYAVYPPALIDRPIQSMCPHSVCTECGEPRRRITDEWGVTIGWTDCGHDSYRRGVVLDPFGGSGTTGMVAEQRGRDSILIDIDERNVTLARERIGMFLEEVAA